MIFVKKCFSDLVFCEKWINRIIQWITTITFTMLVNEKSGNMFHTEPSIRQGNPISPYFFIIYMEYLGWYIHFMWSGIEIKLTKDNPNIPYLCLHCLIFCWATKQAIKNIRYILDYYCRVSRQLVNCHKPEVHIFKRINKTIRNEISDILQITLTNSIRTYLSYCNVDRKRTKADLEEIKK